MPSTDRHAASALVGRSQELAAIEGALDQLAAGHPGALEVVGEAGIGKSRLLSELTARAEARGYLVLEGRAAEFERAVPFGVLLDAVNDYLGALDPALLRALGEEVAAELAEIFPSLAALSTGRSRPGLEAERYRAHYAIRALLERLAANQPVVLALDDMHWSDEGSIEAVAHLLRRFHGPLLTVCAFRLAPARLAAALDTAERAGRCVRLELAPLTAGEADALLEPVIDPARRSALYRESGGNPFYLQELGRAAHHGPLRAGPGSMLSSAHELEVPASVAAAIRDELAELPLGTRKVLESAAVAGEAFEPELVAAIAQLAEPEVLASLDVLLDADVVRPTDAPRRFRFRHPIVRRAVYEWTGRGWLLAAHARAAAALETAGDSLAARAAHVERSAAAGDEQAIALLIEAAREVAPRAPVTAARRLQAALALLTSDAPPELQLTLLTEAADALAQAGVFEEALDALMRALDLVPADHRRQRARLIGQIAAVKRQTGLPLESRDLLDQALRSLPATDTADALTLRLEISINCYFRGEFDAMGHTAVAVLADARARGDPVLVCLAAALASLAASSTVQVEPAKAHLRTALGAFDAIDDEHLIERIDLCGWLGMAAFALEEMNHVLDPVQRGLSLSRASGQGGSNIPGLLNLQVQALILCGRVSEAVRVADTAVDAALLSGNGQLIVWASEAASMAAMWAGDSEGALANAREAVAHSDRLGESFFSPLAQLRLAGALYATGDAAGCREQLASLEATPSRQLLDLAGAHGWELLTRTHLALGDLAAAEETAARAEARAATTQLPQQSATAGCARAAVLLARAQHQAAKRTAQAAIAQAEHAGNPLLAARARALTGRALAAGGERDKAIAALERARAVFLTCGATGEADAAARELRRLGKRVHRRRTAARSRPGALSTREREVAQHVARGETNREVAAALFLSEKTIESHLARIYDKLGVHSRAALATLITSVDETADVPAQLPRR